MAAPPAAEETSPLCLSGCWSGGAIQPNRRRHRGGAVRSARADFVSTTNSVFFPDSVFTCSESLPSVAEAFSTFSVAFPRYGDTELADRIREEEYIHLADRTCLDYSGIGLFSGNSPSTSDFEISFQSPSPEAAIEASIRKRIMKFLSLQEEDYSVSFTASRSSAFKLLADIFPFQKNGKLITVYDHDSEALSAMIEICLKRGGKAMAADFSWPSLRICSETLTKMVVSKRRKKNRGMIVFPLQSLISGARYSYQWMKFARENGWYVALDAFAMAPKDLDTFGLSLIQPDFLICSFFKIFGENPAGFAALLVRRSSSSIMAPERSAGIVGLVPSRVSDLRRNFSDFDRSGEINQMTDLEVSSLEDREQDLNQIMKRSEIEEEPSNGEIHRISCLGESSPEDQKLDLNQYRNETEIEEERSNVRTDQISDLEESSREDRITDLNQNRKEKEIEEIDCRGLNHADSLGMIRISCRLRCITNWLVNAFAKLQHPHPENGEALIKIYGPRVKFDRGPAIAFNIFDWKGEKIEPALVQKLADRSNISLSCGFLCNIWFSEKYDQDKIRVLERRKGKKGVVDFGISVVSANFGFLSSFKDAYRLWEFVAKFLDADFVERERWRYTALNQKVVEI